MREKIEKIQGMPLYCHFLEKNERLVKGQRFGVIVIDKYKTSNAFKRSYHKPISLIIKKIKDET